MANANITLGVNGIDKTGAVFKSIEWRAKQLGSLLKGALAFSGAYFGFHKISEGVEELSNLNDVAMRSGILTEELTKLSTAFDVVGIKGLGVDGIAKAFETLGEKTGRSGLEGFYMTLEELGKIDDLKERSKKAMEVFGGAGHNLMPLINAAQNGTQSIRGVVEALGGVPEAAAKAGDAVSDAKKIGASAFHNIWLRAIGAVCGLFHTNIRNSAVSMGAYMEYGAAVSWRYIKAFFQDVEGQGKRWNLVWQAFKESAIRNIVILSATCWEFLKQVPERFANGIVNGVTWPIRLLNDRYNKLMSDWGDSMSTRLWTNVDKDLKELGISLKDRLTDDLSSAFKDVDTSDLKKKLDEVLKNVPTFTKDVLGSVLSSTARQEMVGDGNNNDGGRFTKNRARNDLILAGSNEALKLRMLGPNLQSLPNEQKKTNEILLRIERCVDRVDTQIRREDEQVVIA